MLFGMSCVSADCRRPKPHDRRPGPPVRPPCRPRRHRFSTAVHRGGECLNLNFCWFFSPFLSIYLSLSFSFSLQMLMSNLCSISEGPSVSFYAQHGGHSFPSSGVSVHGPPSHFHILFICLFDGQPFRVKKKRKSNNNNLRP